MSKPISKIWTSGSSTSVLCIPKKIAEQYGLTDEEHVSLDCRAEGILIKRVEV